MFSSYKVRKPNSKFNSLMKTLLLGGIVSLFFSMFSEGFLDYLDILPAIIAFCNMKYIEKRRGVYNTSIFSKKFIDGAFGSSEKNDVTEEDRKIIFRVGIVRGVVFFLGMSLFRIMCIYFSGEKICNIICWVIIILVLVYFVKVYYIEDRYKKTFRDTEKNSKQNNM